METTIKQISRVTANASIQIVFESDAHTCVSNTNIVSDTIQSITLSITPKGQQTEQPQPSVYGNHQMQTSTYGGNQMQGYCARADWNSSGQTSYVFSDTVTIAERSQIIEVFATVFATLKSEGSTTI